MNTKIYSILSAAALTFSMASCHEDWNVPTAEEGTLSLQTMGVEVSNLEKVINTGVGSRAAADVNSYIVTITNPVTNYNATWTYGSMPEMLTMPVADGYKLSVVSHEVKPAAWEEPLFTGGAEFDIRKNEITSIGVVKCSFASLKVSVKFTDELRALMADDVEVSVVVNDDASLVYTPAETRAGYFAVADGTKTLVAIFRGTVGGNFEELRVVPRDVEAGQHRIITFGVKGNTDPIPDEYGNIDITEGINIDASVVDENLSGNVDVNEDPIEDNDRPQENLVSPTEAVEVAQDEVSETTVVLRGVVNKEGVNEAGFNYRAQGSGAWTYVAATPASRSIAVGTAFSVEVTGLTAGTTYEYVATADRVMPSDPRAIKSFSTKKGDTPPLQDAAEFTSTTLDFDTVNDASKFGEDEGLKPAVVHISCPAGFAHLKVRIVSEGLNADVLNSVGLASEFDLAEPGALKTGIVSLGFPVEDQVIGQHDIDFNITSFVPLLSIYSGDHEFQLEVVDANGNVSVKSLKFKS